MRKRNVIILGCGRSGTSCLTGSISSAGYSIGGKGHAGNEGNPKGYFETKEVNNINDTMLFADTRSILTEGSQHGWLARFPNGMSPQELPDTARRIRAVLEKQPFCIKDPRFSYTLPIWRQYFSDPVCICVVRHPGAVVNSMIKNCRTAPYLSKIKIDRDICYDIWRHMYTHLLRHATLNWIFLHYDQIVNGDGLDIVETAIGSKVDKDFPSAQLCRSGISKDVPKDVDVIYETLCFKAGYDGHEEGR